MALPLTPSIVAGRSAYAAALPSTTSWMGSSTISTSAYSLWMMLMRPALSVGLGKPEGVLGDEAEDHLPADRRDPADAGGVEQHGDAVLGRHAVAAEALHGLVD